MSNTAATTTATTITVLGQNISNVNELLAVFPQKTIGMTNVQIHIDSPEFSTISFSDYLVADGAVYIHTLFDERKQNIMKLLDFLFFGKNKLFTKGFVQVKLIEETNTVLIEVSAKMLGGRFYDFETNEHNVFENFVSQNPFMSQFMTNCPHLVEISDTLPLVQAEQHGMIDSNDVLWLEENDLEVPRAIQRLLAGLLRQNAQQQAQINELKAMLKRS